MGVPSKWEPLTRHRRRLYEALAGHDSKLSAMYLGAVSAFQQEDNPERLVQAAHSFRELLDKLPRYLDLPVPTEEARLGDKIQALDPHWEKVVTHPGWGANDDWKGMIDDALRAFLRKAKEFFEWYRAARPRARRRTAIILRGLDPSGRALPTPIEDLRIQGWIEYRDYFVGIAHHGTEDNSANFESWMTSLEEFLLDRLRPRTFDNQEELRRIIEEAEDAHP